MWRKIVAGVLFVASAVLVIWCGWNLAALAQENDFHEEELQSLYKAAGVPSDSFDVPGNIPDVDIYGLRRENADCIAWLTIPGTDFAYPVMHTPEDPQYYLRRGFDKEEMQHGVPFLDARCTLESDNLIIYGHNMGDGSVFALLHKYRDKDFLEEHPTIYLTTANGIREYQVTAVLQAAESYSPQSWSIFSSLNMDMEEWADLAENLAARTLVDTEVTPQFGKGLLTLSTCENAEGSRRLVVVAAEQ